MKRSYTLNSYTAYFLNSLYATFLSGLYYSSLLLLSVLLHSCRDLCYFFYSSFQSTGSCCLLTGPLSLSSCPFSVLQLSVSTLHSRGKGVGAITSHMMHGIITKLVEVTGQGWCRWLYMCVRVLIRLKWKIISESEKAAKVNYLIWDISLFYFGMPSLTCIHGLQIPRFSSLPLESSGSHDNLVWRLPSL